MAGRVQVDVSSLRDSDVGIANRQETMADSPSDWCDHLMSLLALCGDDVCLKLDSSVCTSFFLTPDFFRDDCRLKITELHLDGIALRVMDDTENGNQIDEVAVGYSPLSREPEDRRQGWKYSRPWGYYHFNFWGKRAFPNLTTVFFNCTGVYDEHPFDNMGYDNAIVGFCDHPTLKTVVLGDNITYIAKLAFLRCDSLLKVSGPAVTHIAKEAIVDCSALTELHFPSRDVRLYASSFYLSNNVARITTPDGRSFLPLSTTTGPGVAFSDFTMAITVSTLEGDNVSLNLSADFNPNDPAECIYRDIEALFPQFKDEEWVIQLPDLDDEILAAIVDRFLGLGLRSMSTVDWLHDPIPKTELDGRCAQLRAWFNCGLMWQICDEQWLIAFDNAKRQRTAAAFTDFAIRSVW